MAYSDADLLNMFKAYSYGSSASELSIQNLSSDDKIRFAKLAEGDWNAQKTDGDADAILKLNSQGIPFSSLLITDVNLYNKFKSSNEINATIVPLDIQPIDSSQLSLTSSDSKYSTAVAAGGVQNPDVANNPTSTVKSAGSILNKSVISGNKLNASPVLATSNTMAVSQPRNDRRARLSPRVAVFDQMITPDGIMAPLRDTYGLMFPITPSISENIDVNYQSYDMAHGLMPIQAYKSGGQKTLGLEATFVAQTDIEARYCLACIHFLRSFSKMNFGDSDPNAGTPPPILVFNAYGDAIFHNLPVIITTGSITWPNDVDYVYTTASSTSQTSVKTTNTMIADGWVPSKFTVSLNLVVQPSPAKLRSFNLEQFRNGNLLSGNGGWI